MPYESYRARLNSYGANRSEATINLSKQSQTQQILSSSTIKYVKLNDNQDLSPCIVSDIETFHKRRFLFLPDTVINVGDYVEHDSHTYLATDRTTDEVYPQLIGEVCNEIFVLKVKGQRIIKGRDDNNRPIYDYPETSYNFPCIFTDKNYNKIENDSLPTPDISLTVKIPYIPDRIPSVNYEFTMQGGTYKVTNVSREHVINGTGFLELRLQRMTGGDS